MSRGKESLLAVVRAEKKRSPAGAHTGDTANFVARGRQRSAALSARHTGERAFTAADDRGITKADELLLPRQARCRGILHCAAQQQHGAWHVCNVAAFRQRWAAVLWAAG